MNEHDISTVSCVQEKTDTRMSMGIKGILVIITCSIILIGGAVAFIGGICFIISAITK